MAHDVHCCDGGDRLRIAAIRGEMVGAEDAGALAAVFTALADPTRVRLISALAEGERCVGELAGALGMTVSAVSHQLSLLRRLRAVKVRREGRHAHYSLADAHIAHMFRYALQHVVEEGAPRVGAAGRAHRGL